MWVAEAVKESLHDEAVVICNPVVLNLLIAQSHNRGYQLLVVKVRYLQAHTHQSQQPFNLATSDGILD
jgi:hypothetical protein